MKHLIISLDETHHLTHDQPLYPQRFDKVQSFHADYAPVVKDTQAFFINHAGNKVFDRVFIQAFGFYDGMATVVDKAGFFHIDEHGKDVHEQRFLWSGNFQEQKCVVQDLDTNLFYHIDASGQAIYAEQYAYVGDYRYGIAVVTLSDGLSTHIDQNGQALHHQFFLELDVYHKGYAIAKDERGYFHINKQGKGMYHARYLKLEPFYNDRAVAIDQYQIKHILSPSGALLSSIDALPAATDKIKNYYANQAFSYWDSRIVVSILELDFLAHFHTPITQNMLYQQSDLPPASIAMLLRWLLVKNLVRRSDKDSFSLNLAGQVLQDHMKPIISYWQSDEFITTSLQLSHSLKDHQERFETQYQAPFFEYVQKNNLSHLESIMSYYATDYHEHLSLMVMKPDAVVCDIGGGNGSLLHHIKQQHVNIKSIILDKFHYQHHGASTFIQKDFFQAWQVPADVYVMSRILHDWSDEKVMRILKHLAHNMNDESTLYVLETVVSDDLHDAKGNSISFHLLNLLGGRERTLAEFTLLFQQAQLHIEAVYLTEMTISLMKVVKK